MKLTISAYMRQTMAIISSLFRVFVMVMSIFFCWFLLQTRLHFLETFTFNMLRGALSLCPTGTKLAQWLSARHDLVDARLRRELSQLHSSAPTHSAATSLYIIRRELGLDVVNELMTDFDENVLASGAIAQVHRLRLKGHKRDLVVKVVHPNVRPRPRYHYHQKT